MLMPGPRRTYKAANAAQLLRGGGGGGEQGAAGIDWCVNEFLYRFIADTCLYKELSWVMHYSVP